MAKQHIAFISQSVKHDAQLAKWLYLMGVEPKEFDTHLHCPEHKNIDKQVPAYHRYAHHLRKVMIRLVDDDMQGFIKTPSEPHDNAISGYLVRTTDQRKISIWYNGVDGINVSNGENRLLGSIPPVNIHPELDGNYHYIDKQQRDILLQFGADNLNKYGVYHPVSTNVYSPEHLDLLADICAKHLTKKFPQEYIKQMLIEFGWTDNEATALSAIQ